jgi:hypothetical protein
MLAIYTEGPISLEECQILEYSLEECQIANMVHVFTRRGHYLMEVCKTYFNSYIYKSLKNYCIIRDIKYADNVSSKMYHWVIGVFNNITKLDP